MLNNVNYNKHESSRVTTTEIIVQNLRALFAPDVFNILFSCSNISEEEKKQKKKHKVIDKYK